MNVGKVFDGFDKGARDGVLVLRPLIIEVAAENPEIGEVEEALRWGQPAYLTSQTKSGSTIRLGVPKTGGFALYVNCQTSLIEDFKPVAPKDMRFEGNRAVLFDDVREIDKGAIRLLILRALTYHTRR